MASCGKLPLVRHCSAVAAYLHIVGECVVYVRVLGYRFVPHGTERHRRIQDNISWRQVPASFTIRSFGRKWEKTGSLLDERGNYRRLFLKLRWRICMQVGGVFQKTLRSLSHESA